MRNTTKTLLSVLMFTTFSGAAMAASEVRSDAGHEVIGHVSVSRAATLDDALARLAKKADKAGAPLYKVTYAGGKNLFSANAVLLK